MGSSGALKAGPLRPRAATSSSETALRSNVPGRPRPGPEHPPKATPPPPGLHRKEAGSKDVGKEGVSPPTASTSGRAEARRH